MDVRMLHSTFNGFAFGGAFFIRQLRAEADSFTNLQDLFNCTPAFGQPELQMNKVTAADAALGRPR